MVYGALNQMDENMNKPKNILLTGLLGLLACSPYDAFKEELDVELRPPAVAFAEATLERVKIREGSEEKEITVQMPTAIYGAQGVQVTYKLSGTAEFGKDYTLQAVERNDPAGGEVIKEASATGGAFVIKNKIQVTDEAGNLVYTNLRNSAALRLSTFSENGIDKPEGKTLDIELTSAASLDDSSLEVQVGQGDIKKVYQIEITDAHCETSLGGTYAAAFVQADVPTPVGDVVLTPITEDTDVWGLYRISNIAGDFFGAPVPFEIIDQCSDFTAPSDPYFQVSGSTEDDGSILLNVQYTFDGNTQVWGLSLTKK